MKEKKELPRILKPDLDITLSESEPHTNPSNSANPRPGKVITLQPKKGVWRTYDATDGLPGGAWRLLQDRKGYLWLGTAVEKDIGTGLCRYDGAEFITFTTDDGLADNYIMSIYEDRQGRLWLGTPAGVSCFDGERFVTHAIDQNSRGHRG